MSKLANDTLTFKSRLMSLDFFRGFTMFLLIGEATLLYEHLSGPGFEGILVGFIGTQLQHHPWNGLRFWDLIQLFFMFIVGVALPFSMGKRWERGDSWSGELAAQIITSLGVWALLWSICYWLYKKKIFVKI